MNRLAVLVSALALAGPAEASIVVICDPPAHNVPLRVHHAPRHHVHKGPCRHHRRHCRIVFIDDRGGGGGGLWEPVATWGGGSGEGGLPDFVWRPLRSPAIPEAPTVVEILIGLGALAAIKWKGRPEGRPPACSAAYPVRS